MYGAMELWSWNKNWNVAHKQTKTAIIVLNMSLHCICMETPGQKNTLQHCSVNCMSCYYVIVVKFTAKAHPLIDDLHYTLATRPSQVHPP